MTKPSSRSTADQGEQDKAAICNLPANLCGSPEQGLRERYFLVANDRLH